MKKNHPLARGAFEEIKNYPFLIWMEAIAELNPNQINAIMRNFRKELSPILVETFIINLPEQDQLKAIETYKDKFDVEGLTFRDFYNCLDEKGKSKLDSIFQDKIPRNYPVELSELSTDELIEEMVKNTNRVKQTSMDDLIEITMTTVKDTEKIFEILDILKDRLDEMSDMRFKVLVGFIKSRAATASDKYWRECRDYSEVNRTIFEKLKPRFKKLSLKDTLSVLEAKVNSCNDNKLGNTIILEFLDNAYDDGTLDKFVNRKTIQSLINEFHERCKQKTYTVEDFEQLVSKVKTDKPQKLIKDDYIEAMVACGKLMEAGMITSENPLFISLRENFKKVIYDSVEHDNTYEDTINLNGLFYRLVKGSLPFDKIFTTKTYKGLIYLSKSGHSYNDPDEITQFLTDEQVAKLDIRPLLRWRKEALEKEKTRKENVDNDDNDDMEFSIFSHPEKEVSFIERMGLQLLCYFGELRAEYLLNSEMTTGNLENLFDPLDYKQIKIDEKGKSIVNEGLIDFFFGKGRLSEKNSIMNKIIRKELPDLAGYFTEICNNYDEVKEGCNGALTVKRILNYFNNTPLAIELKPNEYTFKRSLQEMKTTEIQKLEKGIELCHSARKREYSTIPKVKGKLGNFTYEILDLDDPFSLAVGYLLHNCFIVGGISRTALAHSMESENGRSFVVYHNGNFLANSWMWRNGDIVCFDSVEAGGFAHGVYRDDIKLIDVYKKVAEDIIEKSKENESKEQCIKAVTVGKSDYRWNDALEPVLPNKDGDIPRPLEKNVYVYDSDEQKVLAGKVPNNPKEGPVQVRYKDPRKKVFSFFDIEKADIDELDEAELRFNSIKYEATGDKEPLNLEEVNQLFVGQDWYISANKDGEIEVEILPGDENAIEECIRCARLLGIHCDTRDELDKEIKKSREDIVKQLRLTKLEGNRRG